MLDLIGLSNWVHLDEILVYYTQTMTFSGNNELALHVADPSAAEAFYTGTLGCTDNPLRT